MTVCNGVLRQIGVDCCGTSADQHGKIMRVKALARAHVQAGEGAKALIEQMGVQTARGKDHRHRCAVFADVLVRQEQMPATSAHSVFCLAADTVDCLAQRALARLGVEGAVDDLCGIVKVTDQDVPFPVGDNRAIDHQRTGLGVATIKHVGEVAEPCLEAHDPVFTQTVDRRVGYLAEILPEIM